MKEREREKDLKECSHNVLASGVGPVFSSGRKEREREGKGCASAAYGDVYMFYQIPRATEQQRIRVVCLSHVYI